MITVSPRRDIPKENSVEADYNKSGLVPILGHVGIRKYDFAFKEKL